MLQNLQRNFMILSYLYKPYHQFCEKKTINKKLQVYQRIKTRQKHHPNFRTNQLSPYISKFGQQSSKNLQYKCDGCSTFLQFEDTQKFGYINQQIFKESIEDNTKLIYESYGEKIKNNDDKILTCLHQTEKQTGIDIFNNNGQNIQNLDNLQVLITLQDKIDGYEEEQQLLKRSKKLRKQILCYRCYTLKHHNRLPDEYDFDQKTREEHIVHSLFPKHKMDIEYFFIVDAFDIAGTFQFELFRKLVDQEVKFCIIVNKMDIMNEKYINKTLLVKRLRDKMKEYLKIINKPIEEINVYFLSSTTKDGIKKLKVYLDSSTYQKIQLVGYPNTGKTTLLNTLSHLKKPISKIPGTTTHITQNKYRGNRKIYDMPGLYCEHFLYNLILKPNLRSILTWNKFYSPPILTHSALFYGGKVQIQGVKIIVFGLGGLSSSDNTWFLKNYEEFWKGMPPLHELKMKKYQKVLQFNNGKTQDLQIQGFGFISFRIAQKFRFMSKKLTFYLPEIVKFNFSESILSNDNIIFAPSTQKKNHMLQRLRQETKN